MGGLSMIHAGPRFWIFTGLVLIALSLGTFDHTVAQDTSEYCQTEYGTCILAKEKEGEIGSDCICKVGNIDDPGKIISPLQEKLSDLCATEFVTCQVDPEQMGSSCFCGRDQGFIIP